MKDELVERQGACWLVLLFMDWVPALYWDEGLGNSNDYVSCTLLSGLNT